MGNHVHTWKSFVSVGLIFVTLLQILVKAVKIKQGDKLRIIWPITPTIRYYKEGPCRYLGHLVGHEGEGSLFSVLRTLGRFCIYFSHVSMLMPPDLKLAFPGFSYHVMHENDDQVETRQLFVNYATSSLDYITIHSKCFIWLRH